MTFFLGTQSTNSRVVILKDRTYHCQTIPLYIYITFFHDVLFFFYFSMRKCEKIMTNS